MVIPSTSAIRDDVFFFFFQAEDGIRDSSVTGVQTCALPISKVQVWMTPSATNWPKDDEYFAKAPWTDAEILPPPERWGGALEDDKIPPGTIGFDSAGRPRTWPLRLPTLVPPPPSPHAPSPPTPPLPPPPH